MRKIAIVLIAMLLGGCDDMRKYDGLILTDPRTKRQYLLQHNVGETYFIHERQTLIMGTDTTFIFK